MPRFSSLRIGPTTRAAYKTQKAPTPIRPPDIQGALVVGSFLKRVDGGWEGRPFPAVSWKWFVDGVDAGLENQDFEITADVQGHDVQIKEYGVSVAGGPVENPGPVVRIPAVGLAKLDPLKAGPGIVVSDDDTFTCSTAWEQCVMTNVPIEDDKVCIGVTATGGNHLIFGFANINQNLQSFPGGDAVTGAGYGLHSGQVEPTDEFIAIVPADQQVLIALRKDIGKFYISTDDGAHWNYESGVEMGDPVAGTGGYNFPSGGGPFYVAFATNTGQTINVDFDPSNKPTGFVGHHASGNPVAKPEASSGPQITGSLTDGSTLTIIPAPWTNSPTQITRDIFFDNVKDASQSPTTGTSISTSGKAGKYVHVIEYATNLGGTNSKQSASYGPIENAIPFQFGAVTAAALDTDVESNEVTIPAGWTDVPITIGGDASAQYKKNLDAYTAAAGTVSTGDTLKLKLHSSTSNSVLSQAILSSPLYTTSFNVTTVPATGFETRPVTLYDRFRDTVLSNGNLTLSSARLNGDPTSAFSSWKIYRDEATAAEFTIKALNGPNARVYIGVGTWDAYLGSNCGGPDGNSIGLTISNDTGANGIFYRWDGYVMGMANRAAFGVGSKVLLTVKNNKLYASVDGSAVSFDGTMNPATEAFGISLPWPINHELRFMVSVSGTGMIGVAAVDCNFGASPTTNTLASGVKMMNATQAGHPPVPAPRISKSTTRPTNFNQAMWDHAPGRPATYLSLPATPTRYMDKDHPAAADTNDGLTPDTPWKTLAALNNRAFLPGEFIAFKRGGVYQSPNTDELRDFNRFGITAMGRADAYICFGAYGVGPDPIIKAIDFNFESAINIGTFNGDVPACFIVIEGLEIQGVRNGLEEVVGNEGCINCHIGTHHLEFYYNNMSKAGAGVRTNRGVTTLTAQFNYIHDGYMITNTQFLGNGNDDAGCNSFIIGGDQTYPTSDVELSWNRCENSWLPSFDYGADGGVLELFGVCSNVRMHHNDCFRVQGCLEGGGQPGNIADIDIHHNILEDVGSMIVIHKTGDFISSFFNVKFRDNTIISRTFPYPKSQGLAFWFSDFSSISKSELEVYRNLFHIPTGVIGIFRAGSQYTWPDSHHDNLFCRAGTAAASIPILEGGSLTPDEGLGVGDAIVADLQLTDMATRDFRPLASGSVSTGKGAYT